MRIAEIAEAADDRFFFGGLLTARLEDGVETQLHFRTVNWVASGKVGRRRVFPRTSRDAPSGRAAGASELAHRGGHAAVMDDRPWVALAAGP